MASETFKTSHPRVWIDCEMTGLDPETDQILEIYCIITNGQLNLLDEGWGCVVNQPSHVINQMGAWCTKTHHSSGLVRKVYQSKTTPEEAADALLKYIKTYVPEPNRGLLAGNSVHADKAFLNKGPYKKVIDHLQYRILDVSSIYECAKVWSGLDVLQNIPQKEKKHTAKEDILESIAEARYYKDAIFASHRKIIRQYEDESDSAHEALEVSSPEI